MTFYGLTKSPKGPKKALYGAEEVPNSFLKINWCFKYFISLTKSPKGPIKALFGAEKVPNSILKICWCFKNFFGLKSL